MKSHKICLMLISTVRLIVHIFGVCGAVDSKKKSGVFYHFNRLFALVQVNSP